MKNKQYLVKAVAIAMTAMLATGVLAACSSGAPAANDPETSAKPEAEGKSAASGTLRMVGPAVFAAEEDTTDPVTKQAIPGYKQIMEMAKEEFPDLEVQIEVTPWDSWQAKLQSTAAGGMADILLHGGSIVDVVEDLTPYFDRDPDFAEQLFVPAAIRRVNPEKYTELTPTAVPIGVSPMVIAYDKQLFDDFGVEYPDDDYTWDDLLEMSKKLTGKNPKTGEDCYGIFIGTSAIDTWKPFFSYNFSKEIKTFEFAEQKFETKIMFDTPEVISAFKYFQELAATTPKGFLEGKGNELFATAENNIAMNFAGPIAIYNKTVATELTDRFAYAPYPKREQGEGYSAFVGDSNMAIPKTSSNKDGAWEFIKWMATDQEVADWLVKTNQIPNSKEGIKKLDVFPFKDVTMQSMEVYPANFFYASSEYYDNLFGSAESIFGNNITAMYSGAATPEECAKGMQKEFEEYRDSNR